MLMTNDMVQVWTIDNRNFIGFIINASTDYIELVLKDKREVMIFQSAISYIEKIEQGGKKHGKSCVGRA